MSVDHFVNVVDIVYNESQGFDAITFGALAEVLDSYPYTGVVTYSDWASLHRMIRLSGMLPRDFLRHMSENMAKQVPLSRTLTLALMLTLIRTLTLVIRWFSLFFTP